MAVTETQLKEYLHLPADCGEDLSGFLAAARSKARGAGIPDFSHNAAYDNFILSFAAMLYENRGMAFAGSYQATAEENARRMINSYVLELRFAKEDPEDPEEGNQ